MKRKSKLLLGLSVLTAGVVAAGATSTVAWFTSNKTVSVSYQNITVDGAAGDLSISYTAGHNALAYSGTSTNIVLGSETEISQVSDVSSGDGKTFATHGEYTEQTVSDTVILANAAKVTYYEYSVASSSEGYEGGWISFTLKLSYSGADTTGIYLVSGESLLTDVSSDNAVAKYARVALNYTVDSTDTTKVLAGDATETNYIEKDKVSYITYTDGTLGYADSTGAVAEASACTVVGANSLGTATTDATASNYICDLADEGSIEIVVSIWFEGTTGTNDIHDASTISNAFNTYLKFSLGTAKSSSSTDETTGG